MSEVKAEQLAGNPDAEPKDLPAGLERQDCAVEVLAAELEAKTISLASALELIKSWEFRACLLHAAAKFFRSSPAGALRFFRDARRIIHSGLFDYPFYISQLKDGATSRSHPLVHFMEHGSSGLYDPNPLFDVSFYLETYPEVARSRINPLSHYIKYGARQGRDPHPSFDTSFYLEAYPDVAASGVNPLLHFIRNGAAEGRKPHPDPGLEAVSAAGFQKDKKSREEVPFIKSFFRRILGRKVAREDVAARPDDYEQWIEKNETYDPDAVQQEIAGFKIQPVISIITPVYNVDPRWLDRCIQSVKDQWYPHWELCLYDDASTRKDTLECLSQWENTDPRIIVKYGEINRHIAGASNEALKFATGDFIALLDNDDTLSKFALFEIAGAINSNPQAKYLYSDEDKIDVDENRSTAFFKPGWSPDLLLSCGYTNHLSIYKKDLVDKLGGFRKEFTPSQDYDLLLRFTEKIGDGEIVHIPKILYHWRSIPDSTSVDPCAKNGEVIEKAKAALRDTLRRRHIEAEVSDGFWPSSYRVKRKIAGTPLVSIVIPTRDKVDFLDRCISSIREKSTYPHYEIIVVDNKSKEPETLEYLSSAPVRIVEFREAFNFSRMNNFASRHAQGEYLIFLNNDTEIITPDWIESMLEHAQRPEVGAVGCKLLYPDKSIQHAGVVMGLSPDQVTGVAGHLFCRISYGDHGYFGFASVVRNCCAVTAAAMMLRKSLFELMGGFDEDLAVCYNDVDLCLRLRERGKAIIYTPFAEIFHYESVSRGPSVPLHEAQFMLKRWKEIVRNDCYYSPNLSLITPYCQIRTYD